MFRRSSITAAVVLMLALPRAGLAQTTYHLHNEASNTVNRKQLKTAGPDVGSVALQTANLKSTSNGEKLIKELDTQPGVPGVAGVIPSGATLTFQLWMKKTANVGTLFPRAKVFLNSGPALCTATGTTAITITMTKYTIACNTSANVTLTTGSRFYLWAGANMTAGSTTTNFMAELDIEGTLNGNFDSQFSFPNVVPAPAITPPLAPSSGGIGQQVIITGTNFGASGTVKFFNNKVASTTVWSATSITATVPSGAATGNVTVTVGTQVSNGVSFTVPTPTINFVAPDPSRVGDPVWIYGTNFGASPGMSTVTFNGAPQTTFTSWSATQIQTVVPTGATTGPVVVTVDGVPSAGGSLNVTPTLTSLTPSTAHISDSITIAGLTFKSSQGTSTVTFNGTPATPTTWSDTSISTPVPAGATSGDVVVFVNLWPSNSLPFTVIPSPTVTTATPSSAHVADAVTVAGTNFGATQGSNTIKFNGTTAAPSAWSDTSITAPVPAGATTGNVVVTVSNQASNGLPFNVIVLGTLSGAITRVTGGTGITGATVQALQTGIVKGSATTAANGTYSIATLDPGTYDVRVFATGFSSELRNAQTITSAATTTLNVSMYVPGSVGGRVTQADGLTPLAGAAVTVYSGSMQKGSTNTNGTGDYTIGVLHPGSFTVQASNVGYTTKEQGAAVTENATTTSNFTLQGAPTGPVLYAYDELSRLVQVTDPAGESAIYRYDAVGNITAIERPGLNGVAISDFTPDVGPVGTSVTIAGTGFSTTLAQNTVTFGGTSASVISATATQLATTVPAGLSAGSYTVGVTTPGGSATRDAFVVTSVSAAPTVTGFTPAMAAAGTALTINGTNFDTVPASDNLRLNVAFSQVTSATSTAMQTTVPATATTGRVNVATPNGAAASSNYLWIAPPPYTVADVNSTTTMTVGTATAVSVPTTDKIALLAFEGTEGHRAAVSVNGVAGPVSVFLYGPAGSVVQSAIYVLSDGFVDTAPLRSTGTYSIVFDPQTTNSITGTLTVYDVPPDITSAISFGGPPVDVTTTVPGQNGVLTFAGTPGQKVSIAQTGYNCFQSQTTILAPDGAQLALGCGGAFIDTTSLTSAGTYTILVDPKGAAIGSTTLTLYDVPADFSGQIAFNTATVVTTTVPGQNARMTFSGSANQRIAVNQSGYNCFTSYTTLLKPDGTQLAGTCGGSFIDLTVLPVTGTYTILVNPGGDSTGSTTLTLYDVPADTSGSTTIGGSAVPLAMSSIAQNGLVTFAGTQSQQVTVHVTGNTVNGFLTVRLVGTDGQTVLTETLSISTSFDLSPQTLPVTGTYTVVVDPGGMATGSATVSVTSP